MEPIALMAYGWDGRLLSLRGSSVRPCSSLHSQGKMERARLLLLLLALIACAFRPSVTPATSAAGVAGGCRCLVSPRHHLHPAASGPLVHGQTTP